MAEIIPIRTNRQAIPEASYVVEQDDFSIKVSLEDDPIFWVRLENGIAGPRVTDFNLGSQHEHVLFQGLSRALERMTARQVLTLSFLDIVRGGLQPNRGPVMIDARSRVQRAAEHIASEQGQVIDTIRMQERRGKVDVVVEFRTPE
jgi:hypothetical protein